MMKIAAALVVAALALPALADAKAFKHSGQVTDDPETEITYRVKMSDGKPDSLLGFEALRIVTQCDGAPIRFNFVISGAIEISRRGHFAERIPGNGDAVVRLSGSIEKDGKAGTGNIKSNDFEDHGMSCNVPKQHFKTTAR